MGIWNNIRCKWNRVCESCSPEGYEYRVRGLQIFPDVLVFDGEAPESVLDLSTRHDTTMKKHAPPQMLSSPSTLSVSSSDVYFPPFEQPHHMSESNVARYMRFGLMIGHYRLVYD